ncbi:alpha/beta hydrolase [Sorangium cellulosum]|uniref:Alpha/beta hydrolase n=1 Tax=Sorangium cellulosum TaxID=56 RepID=A0A4P2PWJ8_SORCE|nr:alpha/beta hydrolase [Sorangium cellulosum]AUX20843.1 alpha/beta hydrolase [Sorangium cellulosum]
MGILPLAERVARTALNRTGAQSRWVDTSVCRLHLYDAVGTGPLPTVVLLHGIGSSALPYAPVLQRLRRRARRVIAAEAPGHGWSAAPPSALTPECLTAAMSELLDRELDEPAIVVGNSLGGAVAVHYALSSGRRVRALVLASPAGACMEPAELERLLGQFKLRSRADARAFFERLYHRVPWFTPLVADDVVRMFSHETIRSFTSSARCEHAFTPEQLRSLSMPILLIWGRSDRLMPGTNLQYYRRHLPPHAEIEEPEGVGHCPHVDDPRRFAERVAAFAEEVLLRGAGAAAEAAAGAPPASGVLGERAVPLEQGPGEAVT